MTFQQVRCGDELAEYLGHDGFERGPLGTRSLAGGFGDVLRRTDAGDDVLALSMMSLSKVFDVGTRENRSRYMMFPDLFSSVI